MLEKTKKCVLFSTKSRLDKVSSLGVKYGEIQIKQYCTVTYLGCSLDETFSGELKVMKRAASCKHRQAIKTVQCEKKLFNSHLYSF